MVCSAWHSWGQSANGNDYSLWLREFKTNLALL
jgi:hypothetical protein